MTGYEGAAIYHERIVRNIEAALQVIEGGLQRLDDSPQTKRVRGLLHSRWQRLQQKVIGFQDAALTS